MLIEFQVANFRSFRQEQTLSLVASGDRSHGESLIPCGKYALLKSAALYGANASGKSNLIQALGAVQRFVVSSATEMTLGDLIPNIEPFRLHPNSRAEPSRFSLAVLIDGITYTYHLAATRERVHEERLQVSRSGKKAATWLERAFDSQQQETSWQFRGPLEADAQLLREKTRDNGLVLSRGAELNIEPLKPLFLWLRESVAVYDLSHPPDLLLAKSAEKLKNEPAFQHRVVRMLQDADFGIAGVTVKQNMEESLVRARLETLRQKLHTIQDSPTRDQLLQNIAALEFSVRLHEATPDIETVHLDPVTREPVRFSLRDDESSGTRRFFALAGPMLEALETGSLLVVDEIDCSMHPLLTRKFIELFQSPGLNPRGAQLIFTTHDSSVMDETLFRRDQIWLAEKKRDGATDLYSLYDIKAPRRPRSTEALEKNYLAGRYGGVPQFGPALEDAILP